MSDIIRIKGEGFNKIDLENIKKNMIKFQKEETTWETDFQEFKTFLE